jgi:hypothetical protein
MDAEGKAEAIAPVHRWSPVDGTYTGHCPTHAIAVEPVDEVGVERSA